MSILFIGLDDTDIENTPGTGHLARDIAAVLAQRFALHGVTRHQLLNDPRIPMTAKNSANVIHLELNATHPVHLPTLANEVAGLMLARFQPGSDPGLCVAVNPPTAVTEFGRQAQTRILQKEDALHLAGQHQLILRPLGGTGGGVIGALAAVGLAASGNDGRFNWAGQARELRGVQPVEAILAAGIAWVQTLEGQIISGGMIDTTDKVRPALVNSQPVLLVEPVNGSWRATRRD